MRNVSIKVLLAVERQHNVVSENSVKKNFFFLNWNFSNLRKLRERSLPTSFNCHHPSHSHFISTRTPFQLF